MESTSNAVDEFQYAYVQYIDDEIGNNEVALKREIIRVTVLY